MCVPVPLEGKLIKHEIWKITSEVDMVCDWEGYDLPISIEFEFSICHADR